MPLDITVAIIANGRYDAMWYDTRVHTYSTLTLLTGNTPAAYAIHSFNQFRFVSVSTDYIGDSYSTVQLEFLLRSRRYSCTAVGFTIVTVVDITVTNATVTVTMTKCYRHNCKWSSWWTSDQWHDYCCCCCCYPHDDDYYDYRYCSHHRVVIVSVDTHMENVDGIIVPV